MFTKKKKIKMKERKIKEQHKKKKIYRPNYIKNFPKLKKKNK